MSEHPLAGKTVTFLIDGEEEDYQLEEGISKEDGQVFINSILGVDGPEPPAEVNHPEFEFADIPPSKFPEPEGLRTVCRIDGCESTEAFGTLAQIKDSEWTELSLDKGLLTDRTDLHYAYCPHHSLGVDEGYEPERDMASHKFNNMIPNAVEEELDN